MIPVYDTSSITDSEEALEDEDDEVPSSVGAALNAHAPSANVLQRARRAADCFMVAMVWERGTSIRFAVLFNNDPMSQIGSFSSSFN